MRRCFRVLAAAVSLWLALPVLGQHGMMMTSVFGGQFHPEFSARDLKVMTRVLELSPEAQQALQALYDSYAETLRREGDAVKALAEEEIEKAEVLNDTTLLEPARKRVEEFGKRTAALRKEFLDDLKSLLTREQEANWPILERELRRLKTIGKGKLTGESVDIVRLTEDAIGNDSMPAAVIELLARYREDLDRAIQAREAYIGQEAKEFDKLVKEDLPRAQQVWKESQDLRRSVRDINERYARQVAAELSPEQRAGFDKKLLELSYPMLIRDSRVDEYLKNVQELDTLTAEQKQQLKDVKARHEQQRLAWARGAAAGWRQFEETFKPGPLAAALGEGPDDPYNRRYNGAWLDENHPLNQARVQRLELDRATREAINRVLTPEQRASVPNLNTGSAKFENWVRWGI